MNGWQLSLLRYGFVYGIMHVLSALRGFPDLICVGIETLVALDMLDFFKALEISCILDWRQLLNSTLRPHCLVLLWKALWLS